MRRRSLLLLLGGSLGLWIVVAKMVVPTIIETAYRGQSLSVLNRMIGGRGIHPVRFYLDEWDYMATQGLFIFLILWLTTLVSTSPSFYRRYVGTATPGCLGAIRMLTCAILLISAIWEDLASSALLPKEMRNSMGLLQLFYYLPGFEAFVSSQSALNIFKALTVLILFLGLIGWHTRSVIPLGAFCYFLLGGIIRQYTWFYHVGLVPLYVITALSFTPCGDGWSIDRLRRIYRGQPVPPADRALPVYGWSRYLCWSVVALVYVAAGLSKIGNDGLSWLSAGYVKRIMLRDSLNPMEFDWGISVHLVHAPDFVFTAVGVATVLGELSVGLVLFSSVARLVVPGIMIMMHVGILFLQNVFFPDLIVLQLIFFNFTPLRLVTGQWLCRRWGEIHVIYDGLCPLCRRTVRLLASLDLFRRLEFLDFRRLHLGEYNSSLGLNLTRKELEGEMYVVSRSGVRAGFYAYRTISLALPGLWFIAPWLFLPGVPLLGRLIYDYIARNRLNLFRCHSECPSEFVEEGSGRRVARMEESVRSLRYPLAASAVTVMLLLCWALRIEFYPFTAMQMYTKWGPIGPITYYKVIAHYESGGTARAPLEEAIRALADSRYRTVIAGAFSPADVDLCKKYLTAVGAAYNNRVPPAKRVTEFEVQKWTWDFISNPSDPKYGVLAERFIVEIKTGGDAGKQKAPKRSIVPSET